MTHDPSQTIACTWRDRFDSFIQSRMRSPFEWGTNDCCMFAADAVLAAHGIDHAEDVRGSYSTEKEARRLLRRLGGLAAIASRGGDEIAPLMANVGDVGLIAQEERELLGVCVGGVWLVPTRDGLCAVQIDAAKRAWSVKHG